MNKDLKYLLSIIENYLVTMGPCENLDSVDDSYCGGEDSEYMCNYCLLAKTFQEYMENE